MLIAFSFPGIFLSFTRPVTHAAAQSVFIKTDTMKKYIFLTRINTRKLSDDQNKKRAIEVRDWALDLRKKGILTEGLIFGEDAYAVSGAPDPTVKHIYASSQDDLFLALTFINASDDQEAVNLAKTFPGIHYGAYIEVRELHPPNPPKN